MSNESKHRIVIVGGGTAGITVAARLRHALGRSADLAIIEPAATHYYQPLWTLVGAGVCPKEETARPMRDYIPSGVSWIQDAVAAFQPESNALTTRDGRAVRYDYLIVAPGIQINWGDVKGLRESVGTRGVCSNYAYEYVDSTWNCIREFQGGNAIFTMPNTAVKCGGAPQKIMYLADDAFRRAGVRDKARVIFTAANKAIFSVAKYAKTLEGVIQRKGIETQFRHNLVEIRPDAREALFENLETREVVTLPYSMIHVTPPMGPPDFIKASALANEAGWVDVNKLTLQHTRYPNVFGIGDASSLPTSKTGAAIRKQAPVLVQNLLKLMNNQPPPATYDGYTSCPLVTGYGKLVLAEFDYDLRPKESFPIDQSKERWSMYMLKRHGLPLMYWRGMLRGWL